MICIHAHNLISTLNLIIFTFIFNYFPRFPTTGFNMLGTSPDQVLGADFCATTMHSFT